MAVSSRIDPHCFTWLCVTHHCEKRLERARAELEKRNQTYEQTQYLRGQIAALKDVLALVDRDSEHVSE